MPSVCGANCNVLHVLSMVFVCVCVCVTICENVMVCRWCKCDHICNNSISEFDLWIHETCTHAVNVCGCGMVCECAG